MKIESVARQQLACLGDASRFRIVSELTDGQACVTELAGRIGLSQSCTTRHLQALERAGLVSRERAGRRVLFAVRSHDPAVRSLLEWKTRLEADPGSGAGAGGSSPRSGRRGGRRDAPAAPGAGGAPERRERRRATATGTAPAAGLTSPGRDEQRVTGPDPGPPDAAREAGESAPAETPFERPGRRNHEDLEDFLL